MSPALANFLFEAVNFSLLAAALAWVLFKPVRRALDAERERHAKEGDEARRLKGEAEALASETRAARETAERDQEAQRRELLAASHEQAARLLEEARAAAARERRTLAEELEADRRGQIAALTETLGRIAAESVRTMLAALEGPSLDGALVRAAAKEARAHPPAHPGAVTVDTARPLLPDDRRLLEQVLGGEFRERSVAELGAGVRITTGDGQIDASALALAREAARAVGAALGRERDAR